MERALEPERRHGQEDRDQERVSLRECGLWLRGRICRAVQLRRSLRVQGRVPVRQRLCMPHEAVNTGRRHA